MTTAEEIRCGDCGAPMVLLRGRYGKFYGCSRYPECRGRHGAHLATGKPLGIPADAATRAARIRAHESFDLLWKGPVPQMRRGAAYAWLTMKMARPDHIHIGELNLEECQRVVEICSEALKAGAARP